MFDRILRTISLAAGLSALAIPALSATMTFSDLNLDPFAHTYAEDGMLASGNGDMGLYNPSALHIDDSGTTAPSRVSFSMASNFDAVSFLLDPVAFHFAVFHDDRTITQPTYLNVLVEGFRDGGLVSSMMMDMGASPDPYLVSLGGLFSNLSSLAISILDPDYAFYRSQPGVVFAGGCAPCSHFNVDNVTLSPVPLPAGLPLFLSGLGLLAVIARRRRAL